MKFGVVENNDDSNHPDGYKLGRCQVRVFGNHTENRQNIDDFEYLPTDDLPWFQILLPTTSSGMQYNIENPFVKNGAIVSIEYIDNNEQDGIITGIVLRQPKTLPDFDKGFSDPDENYPTTDDLNKSPLYPYATGEINTIVQDKIDNVATSTLGFSEPTTPYNPTYTKNKVISTKNHFIELDDTPGKERVHIYHKSGTFTEIHPNGNNVTNVKGSQYHIIVNDDNKKVNGAQNIEVDGDINIKSNSDVIITASSITDVNSPLINLNGNVAITGTLVTPDITTVGGGLNIDGVLLNNSIDVGSTHVHEGSPSAPTGSISDTGEPIP